MSQKMLGFNINVDLSIYFNDLRKLSVVFVDISKCKKVKDVEQHIKYLFRLQTDICLVHEKFLLPKNEDAQVFRQCGIIQVQTCDFVDGKIEKEEHSLYNNLALNLIQTEKTVDLSCKPKQRFKSHLNKTQCKVSALSTNDESNEIKPFNKLIFTGTHSKSNSKDKQKRKKKRNHSESFNQDYNDDTGSDILDMSVNKVQKTSHDNCFLSAEYCQPNQDIICKKLNSEIEHKILKKKLKKRKIQPDFLSEECIVPNAVEPLVTDESVTDKPIKNPKNICLDNKCLTFETSHDLDIVCKNKNCIEIIHDRTINPEYVGENSKTYKTRKGCTHLQSEKQEFQQIQNGCLNVEFKNYNHEENGSDYKICLSEKKKLYQNYIDTLLAKTTNVDSTYVFSEDGGCENNNCSIGMGEIKDLHNSSFCNNIVGQNEEKTSPSGEQDLQPLLGFSKTKIKCKRVRRHKKNKNLKYLEAVGPVLQDIATQNEMYSPTTPSTSAKHIYFEDQDFIDESLVNTKAPSGLETSMQGSFGVKNPNTLQELPTNKFPKWQEELLKLASAPKPITFQRFSTCNINLHQTSSHSQEHPSQSPNNYNQKGLSTSPCTALIQNVNIENVETCNLKKNVNTVENICTNEATIPPEKLEDSINHISIDLQNVKLSNYPVIDKVVDEDLILFQLLKLNENNEPDVSKVVLAKVKCSTHFPEKISLQIIEKSGECEISTKADTNIEEAVIELSWRDLVEPRLFYP